MNDEILKSLKNIEEDKQVKIIYACESGSRAWGFASQDSDYDVRFIYMHPKDYYLSVFDDRRDVIELPIDDLLDVNGWDLKKALKLLHKNNLALFEWINSPVVYLDRGVKQTLIDLVNSCFRSDRAHYHYLSMALGFYDKHIVDNSSPNIKKLFYCLRTTVADLWIKRHESMPPVDFTEMLVPELVPTEVSEEILRLIAEKENLNEYDSAIDCSLSVDFIKESLELLKTWKPEQEAASRLEVDSVFKNLLDKFEED